MIAPIIDKGQVAIVGGVRTPLAKAGSALQNVPMPELARIVLQETLYRFQWPADKVDEVILGNVCMPADAANPARVAAIQAGLPQSVPALTVQRNCASGLEAVAQAASRVKGGAKVLLAAGAESMSTVPLLFPNETLAPITRLARAKSLWQKAGAVAALRPRHFRPISALLLGLTDPLSNMIMGKTAEVLAHEFNISREEQDQFALESHLKAISAIDRIDFGERIVPVYAGKNFKPVAHDIGPRADSTVEALAKLRPLFDPKDGSVTVGNSCQVTDGAAGIMVADSDYARSEGLEVLGHIRGYATAALDPARMGLGPVFAIERLLHDTGLDLADIGLFEINEAFAAQVLACLKALDCETFCQRHFSRPGSIGELDPGRLNVNGGAIAWGHPVGATGTRIVLDLLLEMKRHDVQFGIASLCVAGGQGAAILLERG